MKCQQFERLIALHIEGDLPDRQARRLEQHLVWCPTCRAFAEALNESQVTLKDLAEETMGETVLQAMRQRVLHAIRVEPEPIRRTRGTLFFPRWRLGLAGAVVALVAVTAVSILLSTRTAPEPPTGPPEISSISDGKTAPAPPEQLVTDKLKATEGQADQRASARTRTGRTRQDLVTTPIEPPASNPDQLPTEPIHDGSGMALPSPPQPVQNVVLFQPTIASGTVADPLGAVISGALVTLTHKEQGFSVQTRTNESGNYELAIATPGDYRLSVEAQGFKVTRVDDLEVEPGRALTNHFTLDVASVTETVVVSAPTTETVVARSSVSAGVTDGPQRSNRRKPSEDKDTIQKRQMSDLALNGRIARDLAVLTPGSAKNERRKAQTPAPPPPPTEAIRPAAQAEMAQKLPPGVHSNASAVPSAGPVSGSGIGTGTGDGVGPGQRRGLSVAESLQRDGSATVNTERYDSIFENPFLTVSHHPLSTFSIDVDTASYANIRRFLNQGQWPPKDVVRIEEMVNYFTYDYPAPTDGSPFSSHIEMADCPWNPPHRLVRVGLKGKEIDWEHRPATNLVFLIDVSGSMQPENKLPLLKQAMRLLVEKLRATDHIAIVVYAGASGLVLPPTPGNDKAAILSALDNLQAGGSTNGGQGIQLAYDVATANYIEGGVNRVILATDGDFNVGITNADDLRRLIKEKAKTGVFLSVLGFGMGNYQDATLEMLADKGNGNYAYIDTIEEARKVLVEQVTGTLIAIAQDVKIQIEFNPAQVAAYRLIGYENRLLQAEDFNNDKKDAGEIGAGHTVTALYEIIPAGSNEPLPPGTDDPKRPQPDEEDEPPDPDSTRPAIDPLKYQDQSQQLTAAAASGEMLTLKLRYKQPRGFTSELLEFPVTDSNAKLDQASDDFKFASAVAAFGLLLRESNDKGSATFDMVLGLAEPSQRDDPGGYRAEFIDLVRKAQTLVR